MLVPSLLALLVEGETEAEPCPDPFQGECHRSATGKTSSEG